MPARNIRLGGTRGLPVNFCLHKHDEYCDITTFELCVKYYAVLICIPCGGFRYVHRESS